MNDFTKRMLYRYMVMNAWRDKYENDNKYE